MIVNLPLLLLSRFWFLSTFTTVQSEGITVIYCNQLITSFPLGSHVNRMTYSCACTVVLRACNLRHVLRSSLWIMQHSLYVHLAVVSSHCDFMYDGCASLCRLSWTWFAHLFSRAKTWPFCNDLQLCHIYVKYIPLSNILCWPLSRDNISTLRSLPACVLVFCYPEGNWTCRGWVHVRGRISTQ